MNVIKKYWDSVYIYVLLLVPGFCMCAGIYWSVFKWLGLYDNLSWIQIILFDCSQLIYLGIALFFIHKNRKNPTYILDNLVLIKSFIVLSLFIQYNFILYLFPSPHVWECTFLFLAIIAFLFDSKLMLINTVLYFLSLIVAYISLPEAFLPMADGNVAESMAYRIVMYWLTAICIMIIVYFVEHFLILAKESDEENVKLIEKQLEYYKEMELFDRELRKFRHDIVNHFMCMEVLLENEKTEELQEYFQDLQKSFSFQNKLYFSGNDIVDAILNHDLPHYCKDEVNVTVHGSLPEIQTVSAMDLCTLFSNLLSNAIASANQCVGDSKPQLAIHFSGGKRYFSIEVSNSIHEQNGIKNRKQNRNHGYGIPKIKDVLEKYNGRFERNVEQQMLTVTIYLPI